MADGVPRMFCKDCGLLTVYSDPAGLRREFGPAWPFEVGQGDAPPLASLPAAPPVACACRIGRRIEERPYACEAFSPGC